MKEQDNIQDGFQSLHVGGTNGKGSTVAIMDSILRHSGVRVGRFTGPHLLRWNERFHMDGEPISDEEFAHLASRLRAQSEDFGRRHPEFGPLTWFEFLTALAFIYFADNGADVAVIEVGLGGRWDATNVLSRPSVTAITNVDLDHVHILGETVRQIAREKAGIIKSGVPIVTAAAGVGLEEIMMSCQRVNAPMIHCMPPNMISFKACDPSPNRPGVLGETWRLKEICQDAESSVAHCLPSLPLGGSHQQANALVSLAVLSTLWGALESSRLQAAQAGARSVYWPGRFQFLAGHGLILDGAHNTAGALALRKSIDEIFPGRPITFVVGCFQNKDIEAFVSALTSPDDCMMACEAMSRRAVASTQRLAEVARRHQVECWQFPDVSSALSSALSRRHGDGLVVACGSFAVVRECMLHLGWQRVEDGQSGTFSDWNGMAKAGADLRIR